MPLIAKFISYERPIRFVVGREVEAGMVGVWEDRSISPGTYIVAKCLSHDMGAEVFIVEDAYPDDKGKIIVPFADNNRPDEVIPPGFRFEKDIIDYEEENGLLIIQHVMPGNKINSLN